MTTPLNDFKDQVATLWAAVTPPTRPVPRYQRLTGRAPKDGTSADRVFWFDQSVRLRVESEAVAVDGSTVSYTRWGVSARVRLAAAGGGVDAIENATNNELNLLARTVERAAGSWPAGVLEVLDAGSDVEFDEDSGDAVLAISWQVLTAETDGN